MFARAPSTARGAKQIPPTIEKSARIGQSGVVHL